MISLFYTPPPPKSCPSLCSRAVSSLESAGLAWSGSATLGNTAAEQLFLSVMPKVGYQTNHQPDEQVFLLRCAGGDKQGQGDQDLVVRKRPVLITLQKQEKKKRTDSFVAVREWMILDDKIEQMGCFSLYAGIEHPVRQSSGLQPR